LRRRAAVAGDREQAVDEVGRRGRQRERIPAQLIRRCRRLVEAVVEARLVEQLERAMHDRGPDPIQPAAPIRMPRRGERRA
jgi:hypothetical protein